MAYPATPKTWVAGDVLTAAQLNAELRDALLGTFPLGPPDAAWTAYTPTLTQSGTVTKTVTYAKYVRVGRTVVVAVKLPVTGAGTGANAVTVSLPVPAASSSFVVGGGYIFDSSASDTITGIAYLNSTTALALLSTRATGGLLGTGSGFSAALASGDEISMFAIYEAAS